MSGPENGMSVRIFGSEPAEHACGPPRGEAPARMFGVIVRGRVPARMGLAIFEGCQATFSTLPAGNETAG